MDVNGLVFIFPIFTVVVVVGWAVARKMFNIVIILADICRPQIGDGGDTGKYLKGEGKYLDLFSGISH